MDIIIGGGITGLSFAMFEKDPDYLIIEKCPRVGGYCKTNKRNGFVWDYSGHFFHFQDKEIEKMIMKNLEKEDIVTTVKNTKIKYKDRFIEYPFQKNIHQLEKEELIDCIYDLFNNDHKSFSNFKEMLYCKFGKAISEKFLIPYNTKLYACDLNSLDKDAMGRFFPYAEKEDIIKNFKSDNNQSYNSSFEYPKNGAVQYVESISANLEENRIIKSAEVTEIDIHSKHVVLSNGKQLHYDRLISTLPFPKLLSISGISYDESIYSWNQVLVFNIGFDSKGPIDLYHWIYFPENEYCFYRVGFYDNIIGQNRTSLYVELGFEKNQVINPNMFIGKVLKDLVKAGLIYESQTVVDYEAIIMDPAYVHINDRSTNDVLAKKKYLESFNVYSIGRYGSWTYCSIEDNIKEARDLACRLNN